MIMKTILLYIIALTLTFISTQAQPDNSGFQTKELDNYVDVCNPSGGGRYFTSCA